MASNRPKLSLVALSYCEHGTTEGDSESSDASSSSSSSSSSTSDVHSLADSSSSDEASAASSEADDTNTSFYKSAHWTRDGTCILTSSWDNQICSFFLPEDLLEPRDQPLTLQPHWTLQLATPTNVVASAPYYDLRDISTNHLLVASQDHPIQLYQTRSPPRTPEEDDDAQIASGSRQVNPIGSYHFTSQATEAYYPIHSLLWSSPGANFYVGARDLIAHFDVTRNGEGPVSLTPTIPSRRHIRKGNGIGMRGTVSALSAQTTAEDMPTGLTAAGTWTRAIGLYDMTRSGECTATWSIKQAAESVVHTNPPDASGPLSLPTEWKSAGGNTHRICGIAGAGITQTAWSPCGRYLLLNERQSTGMLVYDVRGTNKVLGFLAGRDARTHKRMDCDVFRGLDSVGGFEVWGGAVDGTVKVWEGVGNIEGCQWPSWEFSAADGADGASGAVAPAVGSVGLHQSGSVVATCAGSWAVPEDGMEESSLKLWSIGASEVPTEVEGTAMPEHVDTAMSEADEIEQRKQRIISSLYTTGADEPVLMDESTADEGVDESRHQAATIKPEALVSVTVKADGGDDSQHQQLAEPELMDISVGEVEDADKLHHQDAAELAPAKLLNEA